jgi:predicted dinucleotide-binding enzyme
VGAGSRVVKIFNTTDFNIMLDPRFGSESATMFLCGDDAAAKQAMAALASDLGFEPLDAGRRARTCPRRRLAYAPQ